MTALGVRRGYATAVAVVLVWPAFQWGLVTFANVDPWKLCGFAMYAIHQNVDVLIVDTTDGSRNNLMQKLRPPISRARKAWLRNRRVLGDLVRPDALADVVFDTMKKVDRVGIVVVTRRLGPRSSLFVEDRRRYNYERPAKEPR